MNATARHVFAFAALFAGLAATGCGDDGDGGSPSPTTSSRPWVHEAEQSRDSSLHVTPEQVVVLHLEPRPAGAEVVQHTLRYLVQKAGNVRFCIPPDEPHLRHLELAAAAGGGPLVRTERGGDCGATRVPPGTYELHISHEGANVPAQGTTAFLHRPRPSTAGGRAAAATQWPPNFMAFRYGGQFVTARNPSSSWCNAPLRAAGGGVLDLHSVFRVLGSAPDYAVSDGTGAWLQYEFRPIPMPHESPPTGPTDQLAVMPAGNNCGWNFLETEWEFVDGGNGQFSICLSPGGCLAVDPGTSEWPYLSSLILGNEVGSTFTIDYKGYDCTPSACDASTLDLQAGEVALFGQPDYQGPAFVFRADVPDFSIYNAVTSQGLAIGDDLVQSVRVGPNTLAYLYQGANYGGAAIGVASDVPSLAGTAVGNAAASSMHLDVLGDYIVSTKACENCILTGVDLSGLDLTGADLSGARLANADLSGTTLLESRLDHTVLSGTTLSGTDFTAASLRCADFSDTDLTSARFGSLHSMVLVADENGRSIVKTNPVSGDRVEVSGPTIGTGTPFGQPVAVAVASDGTLFVADSSVGVFRVDRITGARTVVFSPSSLRESGDSIDVAVNSTGQLLVLGDRGDVVQVDPASGSSMLVSLAGSKGTGPAATGASGLAIEPTGGVGGGGRLVVAAPGAVIAIEPTTGNRTILLSGEGFALPFDVAFDSNGNLFVIDFPNSVFSVDLDKGTQTAVSGSTSGTGPSLEQPVSIAAAWDGTLFVTDQGLGAVFRVDPTTGDRTILSDATHGSGPQYQSPSGLATAPGLPIASDFSCRLAANGATIDAGPGTQTFPLASWRYMDLTNATITNATAGALSTEAHPLDLSGAILNGAKGLSGAALDGVSLDCATPSAQETNCTQLNGTDLFGASLNKASAVQASLLGINLNSAKLQSTSFNGAFLGPCVANAQDCATGAGPAATMVDAYMPNVDLSGAQLCRVDLTGALLFSDSATTSFVNAKLTSAKLPNAICSGADFTGAALQCASFDDANLVTCTFSGSDLTNASFDGSALQGANFSGAAAVGGASLYNAVVSTTTGEWTYLPDGGSVTYDYGPTVLGALATEATVECPNGDTGPCVGDKLTPASAAATPTPSCRPAPPDYTPCPE